METLQIEVTGKKSLVLPWEEVQIMPLGDIHLGQQGVDTDRLRLYIEWGLKQGNVYFLGMGDYLDVMSPSNRHAYRSARLYESARAAMEEQAARLVGQFLELVKGSEGRWLGLLGGHHMFEFEDGTTSDTRIAQALKTSYLGSCAMLGLTFARKTGQHTNANHRCVVWCHHGAGGGLTPHSPLLRLAYVMRDFEADIYLIGHQHKKPTLKQPRIYMSDHAPYRLVAKNKILAGTGGFFEGYHQGNKTLGGRAEGSYVEQHLLPPTALGGVLLKIRPVHNGGKNDRLDLNVEV